MKINRINSSFRDPSGFVFVIDGNIYRQINYRYKKNYEIFMRSGLYEKLISEKLIIPHEEIDKNKFKHDENCYKILKPSKVKIISYPYEWSFSQLKDAAIATLKIQKIALKYGMSLKDCSGYNIQFEKGQPVFIDTLSFEEYLEGKPWIAYRQFCQHFLAPLTLMSYRDVSLGSLLRIHIDGIPINLASELLPLSSYLSISIIIHVHLHAKSQKKYEQYENYKKEAKKTNVYKKGLETLIDSLESIIKKLKIKKIKTEWSDYYDDTNYSEISFNHKKEIVKDFLAEIKPSMVWDLGANAGIFSQIPVNMKIPTISFDYDPLAVEKGYKSKNNGEEILFLIMDLTNPSPSIGWRCKERMSLFERGPVDTLMALALIHHLTISNNVPLEMVAQFFSEICQNLIIEFIPKDDSQVLKLLKTRDDIFDEYNDEQFQLNFKKYFQLVERIEIKDSKRILYRFKKSNSDYKQ